MFARKTLSTLTLISGLFIGSTAWAFTFDLTPSTLVSVNEGDEIVDIPFTYLKSIEQELVELSVESYNAGRAQAKGCNRLEHEPGYPLFSCESDDTICYAGWVVPEDGMLHFDIGCGDSDPDPQGEMVQFECCEEQTGTHVYDDCTQSAGLVSQSECGGIYVPCSEAWVNCN